MNEELIRQCAREGAAKAWEDCKDIPPAASKSLAQQARSGDLDDFEAVQAARNAIRLYHARLVAPLVEAATTLAVAMRTDHHEVSNGPIGEWADGSPLCTTIEMIAAVEQALAAFQQEAK